jgi:(p)ppGpp synthase/HD superfamily hydrolase
MVDNNNIFFDFQKEKHTRLSQIENQDDDIVENFINYYESIEGIDKGLVDKSLGFALDLEYSHGDLSKEAYLAHPLRIAKLALDYVEIEKTNTTALCLLHNVLEVSSVSSERVEQVFGQEMSQSLEVLTVNRELQWEDDYKRDYYMKINDSFWFTRTVKVLDKFDNIFIIGTNKDAVIRKKYVEEIQKYVLPICKEVLPNMLDSFEQACIFAELELN